MYYHNQREQFIHEFGLTWLSKPLWNRVEFQISTGLSCIRAQVVSLKAEDNKAFIHVGNKKYSYPLNVHLGFNYLLHKENKHTTTDSTLGIKDLKISHDFLFNTASTEVTLYKSSIDIGLGLNLEFIKPIEKAYYTTSYRSISLSLYAREEFKTNRKVKPWLASNISKTIIYGTTNEYKSEQKMNNLKFVLELGLKRTVLPNISIGVSVDHIYLHNYTKTLHNYNELGWSLSGHLFIDI